MQIISEIFVFVFPWFLHAMEFNISMTLHLYLNLIQVHGASAVRVKQAEDPVELLIHRVEAQGALGLHVLHKVHGPASVDIKHFKHSVSNQGILRTK